MHCCQQRLDALAHVGMIVQDKYNGLAVRARSVLEFSFVRRVGRKPDAQIVPAAGLEGTEL